MTGQVARRDSYRLAIVVPEFPNLSETFVVERVCGLLDRGVDVHVICNRSQALGWDHFPHLDRARIRRRVHVRRGGRRWRRLPTVAGSVIRRPRRSSRFIRSGARSGSRVFARLFEAGPLIRLAPDIIHYEFGSVAVGREDVPRSVGCRSVVSFQGADANYVALDRPGYFDAVWNAVDAVHVVSTDLWRRVRDRGCPSDVPHAVIPPIPARWLAEPSNRRHVDIAGTRDRPLRMLSVGRLHWKRGLEYGLEAVRLLGEDGIECRFRVVGDGPFRDAVTFAARQLDIESKVELVGALSPPKVRQEMTRADVLLHPAVSEGFSLVALEAQATRLPVVATDADGLRENVEDGRTGFIVSRRRPDELADRAARLARDPALRDRLGAAGERRVANRFDREELLDTFDRFYRRVLAS